MLKKQYKKKIKIISELRYASQSNINSSRKNFNRYKPDLENENSNYSYILLLYIQNF